MKIELLYSEGYASWRTALVNVKSALQIEGIQAKVELVRIWMMERPPSWLAFLFMAIPLSLSLGVPHHMVVA